MKIKKSKDYCHSFKPFIHESSQVLILGSMPGPEALRKQEYYGFSGNHFWSIIPALFHLPKPDSYELKLALIKKHHIALWDVIESCERPGALDSSIRNVAPNPVPDLLNKYPSLRAIFINGKFAFSVFQKAHAGKIFVPVFCLPSSSPANAMMSLEEKKNRWGVIKDFLK
ncbi:MAG: DNA-deoxyinosine glycosylase [Elusimicrobiota bacterium]